MILGTWRQGLVTFAGVFPVSLVLNLALAPLLAGLLPRIAIIAINAAILVAALNWALLPVLHWATKGWAVRTRTSTPSPGIVPDVEADNRGTSQSSTQASLSVLEYLQRQLAGTLRPGDTTHVRYPTAISRLLGIEIIEVAERMATVRIAADVKCHGNQQGTVHGGLLCELADAAIGTAHSTVIEPAESFTSLDLDARFVRPAWSGTLIATAHCTHSGRTISQYQCDIRREDGKTIATVTSAVMTLRGEAAAGR